MGVKPLLADVTRSFAIDDQELKFQGFILDWARIGQLTFMGHVIWLRTVFLLASHTLSKYSLQQENTANQNV